MKKIIFVFKVLLFSTLLSSLVGCVSFSAFSRLTEPHTARTLGQGNNELEISLGRFSKRRLLVPEYSQSLEYTRGFSDNFDLAMFVEMQNNNKVQIPLVGLEGKYKLILKEQHILSLLLGVGLNKQDNQYTIDAYDKTDGNYEDYKKVAEDLLLGYFSYIGPVYSFKLNDKYELALNLRINHSYSQYTNRSLDHVNQSLDLANQSIDLMNEAMNIISFGVYGKDADKVKKNETTKIQKYSLSLLYGSANMSHTWWIVPSFGATLSLGIMYPFYILGDEESIHDEDDYSWLAKYGLNFHFNF